MLDDDEKKDLVEALKLTHRALTRNTPAGDHQAAVAKAREQLQKHAPEHLEDEGT